jgi:hypothetical protein
MMFFKKYVAKFKQAQAVGLLLYTAKKSVKIPDYARSYTTFCNVFSRDFLTKGALINTYDFDLSPICQRDPAALKKIHHYTIDPYKILLYWTPIEIAYKNAILAAQENSIIEHTAESAQARANEGTPIWVTTVKYYHEAIVIPDKNKFNPARGVLLANQGEHAGIMYISDNRTIGYYGPDAHINSEVKYYEFKHRRN